VLVGVVADERDRCGVGAERRAGERKPASRRLERLPNAIAPAECVAAVMNLVEDDEGSSVLGDRAVQHGTERDLGVGDGDPVEVPALPAVAVSEGRIQAHSHPVSGIGPLALEVLGGCHDRHSIDHPAGQQFGDEPQRECRLTGTRGRGDEEVPGVTLEIAVDGLRLPGAQFLRGSACCALRKGRRQMFGCRGARRKPEHRR
jgi:hypothetical protein